MIRNKQLAVLGAVFLTTSIVLGAMGAHSLKNVFDSELMTSYNTATEYISIHGLAFLILSLMRAEIKNAARVVQFGVLIFSLSIYLLVFLKASKVEISGFIGLITPLGGLMMIAGWIWITIEIGRAKEHKSSGK